MTLVITAPLLEAIHAHGEATYPEEGAGFILGTIEEQQRVAKRVLPQANLFDPAMRRRRYSISPQDMLRAEREADEMDLEIIAIFHSHPDHPAKPSTYDLEHSLPWFFYLITRVEGAGAKESQVWLLREDRSAFTEVPLQVVSPIASKENV